MRFIVRIVAAGLLAGSAASSPAQPEKGYPDKLTRIVVPWAAGGNIDVLTRVVAQKLSQAWRQQIVVDNRGGANGMIGSEMVVRSDPDGYTLVVDGLQTHAINPYIFAKMAYDTQRDLAPITLLGAVQHILVAHPSLPVKTTRDLVALAKSRPNDIAYATFGTGSMPHVAGELKAPDYDVTSVFAFMAPAGTPRPIINKLHAGITQVLALPEVRKTYASLGATSPQPLIPEDTLAMLRSESIRWGKVLRAANIKSNQP